MELRGKRALVVGLGLSGEAAARLLMKKGARVTIVDEKKAPGRSVPKGARLLSGVKRFPTDVDLIVTSPGVPWDHPELERARSRRVPVLGELELSWQFVSPRKTIAITGTNGKTTTTALMGWLLKKSRRPVVVGGNIGSPLAGLTGRINSKTFLVLEVSSYQLEAQSSFHPNVGLVLNVTPDHLARHKTMSRYAQAKARVFRNMNGSDTAVLNSADKWCCAMATATKAKKVFFPNPRLLRLAKHIRLPGQHNLENAMAASAAALAVGLTKREIILGLSSFKGVKHRIQPVRKRRGVDYINDSKATNVDSTLVALKACRAPMHLILGGEHKGSPYTPLKALIKKKVKTILTIGEAAPIVARDLRGVVPIVSCKTLDRAVSYAAKTALAGETVLLSPACASFDQYNNYEERGDHFIRLVEKMQ